MRELIGFFLLATPLAFIVGMMIKELGFWEAAGVIGFSLMVTASIYAGLFLMTGGEV